MFRLHARWLGDPARFSLGFAMLLSGHHFIRYANNVAEQLEGEVSRLAIEKESAEFSTEPAQAEIQT